MKLFYSFILAILSVASVTAQEKINAAGRIIINDYIHEVQRVKEQGLKNINSTQLPSEPEISAIVILEKGYDSSVLKSLDVEVLSEMNGVLVVKCPLLMTEKIAELPQVRSVEFGQKLKPHMNYARPSGKVDDVQSGFNYEGSELNFDGTGVIVGMMDTGLEANHINFKKDDGTSRIQRLWYMKSDDGSYDEYDAETVKNFTTDKSSESHATHVAGIMGGSYNGNGTYRYASTATAPSCTERTNQPIPYYGVATGSDLALAVGELYTTNIVQGVTNIMDYAESVGKPAVVNLSLGHVVGPHDGTDSYSEALSRLGERGIVCMSAGNDGDKEITVIKKLTSSTGNNSYLRLLPFSETISQNTIVTDYGTANGIVDVWSSNGEQVTLTLKALTGNVIANATPVLSCKTSGTFRSSDSNNFSTYFSGSLTALLGKNAANNRYEVYLILNNVVAKTGAVLLLELKAPQNTTLYAFGSDVVFDNRVSNGAATISAVSKGSAVNSINDGACADNIISVGAYTSRETWGTFGNSYCYAYNGHTKVNQLASFSSYGQKFISETESVNLPLVSGPGTAIISSFSSYYVNSKKATNSMTAKVSSDNSTYYWGAMQGTSMSCPFVTGTIGLWLQADPTLNYERVLDVINKTSTYNVMTNGGTKAKWGAGMINGIEGIKEVLANKAAVGEVWADDNKRLIVTDNGNGYEVFVADGGQLTATLYDLQGRPVARALGADGTATIDCGSLASGLYIMEARSDSYRLTRKLTRR